MSRRAIKDARIGLCAGIMIFAIVVMPLLKAREENITRSMINDDSPPVIYFRELN
ncbi:MAG: hypothetical protein JW869_01760 [Candidatus Omnitrophica bacterium]|nr:hypothetical protein [Candidatus Omnitrophota bacterium]